MLKKSPIGNGSETQELYFLTTLDLENRELDIETTVDNFPTLKQPSPVHGSSTNSTLEMLVPPGRPCSSTSALQHLCVKHSIFLYR
ncbi:hypothetical protein PVL29_026150 [Vitis rotundifolia]|uniref:Uncharacterized protein n=1 Tax=Vitis rotundifolia TaxID=103349 RepID=A0AA38YLT7_VITRO|nr:hypothetical protein PVL29_026150 [Vitis rotundifolia]